MKFNYTFNYSTFLSFYEKISKTLDNWDRNTTYEEKLVYLNLDKLAAKLYPLTYKDIGTIKVKFTEIEMLTILAALPKISYVTGNYESIQLNQFYQSIDQQMLIY